MPSPLGWWSKLKHIYLCQRTEKWIRKIRSCGEGCRNSGRSQESHVEEYGEGRVDNNAISTDDHRLLNTLMLKDDVVLHNDGQEAVQGDQHVQREEQEDDGHSCSNLEDNFEEKTVFNNQESFSLAETKLYNKPVSCTTAPATNRGREGRHHTSSNIYGETSTEYSDRVKLAGQGDPVQDVHGPHHHYHPQEDGHEDRHEEEPQDMINTDMISVIRNLTDRHYEVGRLQGRPQASAEGQLEEDVGGSGHEHGRYGGAGHGESLRGRKKKCEEKIEAGVVQSKITSFIKMFPNLRKT